MVSVIIPTWNRRDLVARAIASVRAQTFADWELLVVDDGSTDGTASAMPSDPRVTLISRTRSGNVAAVRNAGLDRATGEYVAFLDSDDRWRPDKLARQVARLAAAPEHGWCHADYQLVGLDGAARPRAGGWMPQDGNLLASLLEGRAGISIVTILVRRAIAQAVRFDERIPFGEDRDFVLQLASRSTACAVDAVVADVLVHEGRGTGARYDHFLGAMMACRKIRRSAADPETKALAGRAARHQLRTFLAHARANGRAWRGARQAWTAWWTA